MALMYDANQFNEPFKPTFLKNWEQTNKGIFPGSTPKRRDPNQPICFIAGSNGHLFPSLRSKVRTSPWGTGGCIWELPFEKGMPKEREPLIPNYFKRKCNSEATETVEIPYINYDSTDPIRDFFCEKQFPIVWFIGLPTPKTEDCRRIIQKSLASKYGFTIIDLDKVISEWIVRAYQAKYKTRRGKGLKFDRDYGKCISIELKIDGSIVKEIGFQPPPESLRKTKLSCYISPGNIKMSRNGLPVVEFNIAKKLTREKIVQLLKYAMLEKLPTNGFIIDGFPYDVKDAYLFEQSVYEAKMGIYFGNKVNDSWTKANEVGYLIYGDSETINPKNFKRDVEFSPVEADHLCHVYGRKTVRIAPDRASRPTTVIKLVSILVEKNLRSNCPELIGFTNEDLEAVRDSTPEETESPRNIIRFGSEDEAETPLMPLTALPNFLEPKHKFISPSSKITIDSRHKRKADAAQIPKMYELYGDSLVNSRGPETGKTYTVACGVISPTSSICLSRSGGGDSSWSSKSNSNVLESNPPKTYDITSGTSPATAQYLSLSSTPFYTDDFESTTPRHTAFTSARSTALSDSGRKTTGNVAWKPPPRWTTCSDTDIRRTPSFNNNDPRRGSSVMTPTRNINYALKSSSPGYSASSGGGGPDCFYESQNQETDRSSCSRRMTAAPSSRNSYSRQ